MKLIKKSIAVLVLLVTASLTVNCSSSSSSDGTPAETTFYLKCKINGVQFTSSDPFVGNSLAKAITATSDNTAIQETVTLWTPLSVTVGTHNITDEPSNVNSYGASYSNFTADLAINDPAGTMIITEVNADVIKGTFAFTGTDGDGGTITVTEGTFRAENVTEEGKK